MAENTSNTNNSEHTIMAEQTNLPAEIDSGNSNKIKFHHLSPEKAENYDLYSDAFDDAFKDEQITNIAVTGPYASGKSSIMQACKEKYGKEKFLTLSLTNFTQENNNDKKEIEENLEAQLVNQLIHKIDKSKIQESKFLISHKIDSDIEIIKNKIYKNNKLILLLITSIVILSFNGDMFANTINLIEKYFSKYINIIFSIFEAVKLIAIFVIAGIVIKFFPSMLYQIISLIKKNKFRRINLYGNEIELFNNEDNSIFDKHTDEILYLFENAGVKYFIFEDIDRYEDVTVFKKLREINILLNDKRKRENKPLIKFIYLICDNMFTAEERTKFFDFIIPVVPYIHKGNAYDYMAELFTDEIKDERNRKFLIKISLFLDNARLLKNIVNEYHIYNKFIHLKDREPYTKFIKLLSLIIYKNLFPKDFNLLYFNKGYLAELFNKEAFAKREEKSVEEYKNKTIRECINVNTQDIFFKAPEGYDYIYDSGYMNLIKFLITDGYIDETYKDYISEITENSLTYEERLFLQNIIAHNGKQFNLELTRINNKLYLRNLMIFIDEKDYDKIEILNINLLNQLIHYNYSEYYNKIFSQFINNSNTFEFIEMYYNHIGTNFIKDNACDNLDYERINKTFTMFILNNYEKLFNLYKEHSFFINIILNIIKENREIFKNIVNNIVDAKAINLIKSNIATDRIYIQTINASYNNTFYYYANGHKKDYTTEDIMDDLAYIEIVFNDITRIYRKTNFPEDKVYNAAIKNLMFEANFNNINYILHFLDNTTEWNNPIDIVNRIFNLENIELQQYIFKNFDIFVHTWYEKRNLFLTRDLYIKIKNEKLIPYEAKDFLEKSKINIIQQEIMI